MLPTLLVSLVLAQSGNATLPGSASSLHGQPGAAVNGNASLPSTPTSLRRRAPNPSRSAHTPMDASAAQLHLHLAYRIVLNEAPELKTLALLLAQWALETGRGDNMWGYNFGGIKSKFGGVDLDTSESFGLARQLSTQRFRVYRSAAEGAKDYIQTLSRSFPRAFEALHGGSAQEFVQALSEGGYFTGSPEEYARAISRLALEYERAL
jgi:hypothetical protein